MDNDRSRPEMSTPVQSRMSGRRRCSATSFLGVLPVLSAAADSFIALLKVHVGLSTARLVCKELRTFIDEHVPELDINVRYEDQQKWGNHRQVLPLARWPSCKIITLKLTLHESQLSSHRDFGDAFLTSLLALPFTGVTVKASHHIARLVLKTDLPNTRVWNPESALLPLLLKLRSLRQLDLKGIIGMSYRPLHLQIMYDALATLPQLEELTLPGCSALDGIGTLAGGSLQRLAASGDQGNLDHVRFRKILKDIASLQQLKILELGHNRFCQGTKVEGTSDADLNNVNLLQLLNGLPASLTQLRVSIKYTARIIMDPPARCITIDLICDLQAKRLQAVSVTGPSEEPISMSRLCAVAHLLLHSELMAGGQRLQRFTVYRVGVRPAWRDHQQQEVQVPSRLQSLRMLMGRSGRVDMGKLVASGRTTQAAVQGAMVGLEWLAPTVPQFIKVGDYPGAQVRLRAAKREPQHQPLQPQQQLPDSGAIVPAHHPPAPPEVPSAAVLGQRVIQRLAGAASPVDAPEAAAGGIHTGSEGGGGVGSSSPSSSRRRAVVKGTRAGTSTTQPQPENTSSGCPRILLLWGPLVPILAADSALFMGWIKRIAAARNDCIFTGGHQASLQVLPTPTAAALVECGSADATFRMAAALVSETASLPEGLMRVAVLARRKSSQLTSEYFNSLRKELQVIWDSRVGSVAAGGDQERELLRQLLEVAEQLTKLTVARAY